MIQQYTIHYNSNPILERKVANKYVYQKPASIIHNVGGLNGREKLE